MHDTLPAGRVGLLTEPRRNKYFYGKLLDVAHLHMEQSYFNQKRWLLNRLSIGHGVLCGLNVEARDGQLCVTRGVAIDPLGREIIVPATVCIDPWNPIDDCGRADAELSPDESYDAYLCLEYKECSADFMPVPATECDTRNQSTAGTIVESFRLSIEIIDAEDPPPLPNRPGPLICAALGKGDAVEKIEGICDALSGLECEAPANSETSCVKLARVKLNGRTTQEADPTIGQIQVCSVRPMAHSNALLFDMILCLAARVDECCAPSSPVIIEAWPKNGAALETEEDRKRLVASAGGIQLTFNRQMDGAMLANPDSWLRLWAIFTPTATTHVPPATGFRIKLKPVGPIPTPHSSTMNYSLEVIPEGTVTTEPGALTTQAFFSSAGSAGPQPVAFLLVIRADGNSITDTSGKLLDADFGGTALDFEAVGVSPDVPPERKLLDALWEMNLGESRRFNRAEFAGRLITSDSVSLPTKGSGNGSPGGLFHSAFTVIPPSPSPT